MLNYQPLTDLQWQQLEHLFPKPAKRGRGKPHTPWRCVVNSIFMVLLSKEKWSSVPKSSEFATKSATHRWFAIWDKSGFLETLVKAYQAIAQEGVEMVSPPRRNRLPKSSSCHTICFKTEDASIDEGMPHMERREAMV